MADLLDTTMVSDVYDGTWTDALETRAQRWVTAVAARARTVAPCLKNVDGIDPDVLESARGILIGAVLRHLSGDTTSAATVSQSAGGFSHTVDTKLRSDRVLSIPDRDELRQLCRRTTKKRRGGTIRTPIGY